MALTGDNCTIGGQTIISLSVTEDIDADFATAAAVCLAPRGPHLPGTVVESREGGVSTGLWCVVEAIVKDSGKETWRRRAGESVYKHLRLVSYRLLRAGYQQARTTLSKSVVGKDHYPPRFATKGKLAEIKEELARRKEAGEISRWQYEKELGSYIQVSNAKQIIDMIAGWAGLPVNYRSKLPCCAELYQPVSMPAISAIKEVAGWSGARCYLDRRGTLIIYDFNEVYNRGGMMPVPPIVAEMELRQALCETTQVTVVGSGYAAYEIPATPGHFRAPGGNPRIPRWVPPRPAEKIKLNKVKAVEWTESLGSPAVERRLEINNYSINPVIAEKLAQGLLTEVATRAYTATVRGPAEGAQHIEPVKHKVLAVTRTLEWTGSRYRYECAITGTTLAGVAWQDTASNRGWW